MLMMIKCQALLQLLACCRLACYCSRHVGLRTAASCSRRVCSS